MSMKINMNVAKFKEELRATADVLHAASRPAAQAGAQIIYDAAKRNASTLRSDREHWFYGTSAKKAAKGSKRAKAYGPFVPGTLYNSIYQAFSKDNSFKDVSTYHISWNAEKAPYGGMVEFGTLKAAAHSFIGKAVTETRSAVREVMSKRYTEEVERMMANGIRG